MTCTTPDCGNPTDLYLCRDCVRDLQAWIDKARELLPDLEVTILRLDNVRRRSEGGNGGKSGSAAPLNLDAFQLRENIQTLTKAEDYAHDPKAAGIATLIRTWATNAELAISGPEDEGPDPTAPQKLRDRVPGPMKTRALTEWLRVAHGIDVLPATIRKWAERGRITRTNTDGHPEYDPAAVLLAAKEGVARNVGD